jgi:hypothetical protein
MVAPIARKDAKVKINRLDPSTQALYAEFLDRLRPRGAFVCALLSINCWYLKCAPAPI